MSPLTPILISVVVLATSMVPTYGGHTAEEWEQIAELIEEAPEPYGGLTVAEWHELARIINPPPAPSGPSLAQWETLRQCESGGNYRITNPSGKYRGAYQFDQPTWDSVAPHLAGQDPAQASVVDQDAAALALWQSRGWQPWPVCGRKAAAG